MMGRSPRSPLPEPPPFRPAPPRRPRHQASAALVAGLIGSLGLTGCTSPGGPPVVLQIAIGTSPDQVIDGRLHQEFRDRLQRLERGFRQLHPNTIFRFSLYPEADLVDAMRRRQWSGLEPDLLFVTGRAAHRMLQAGVTIPYPASAELRGRFEPPLLHMVSYGKDSLSGLPVLQQLQVSCFDTRRLPKPPADLDALLAASASGVPIGLAMASDSLFWTVGSVGALPSMERLLAGSPPRDEDRAALGSWLAWLATASNQQRVVFYGNQDQAEEELTKGELAWIPCRSTTLPRLRKAMGNRLGVAPLPDGAAGQASPINHTRVLALGSNSTQRARRAAIAFSEFSVNPLVQRGITLGSFTVLPVNQHIAIPVSSSRTLAALVRAREQGLQSEQLLRLLRPGDTRPAQVQELFGELVFGELSPERATSRLIRILQPKP